MEKRKITTQSILLYSFILLLLITISKQLTQNQSNSIKSLHHSIEQNPISSQPIHPEGDQNYQKNQEQTPLLPPPSPHHPPKTSQINLKNLKNKNKSFNHFFSTQNSFWFISFKVLKTTLRWIFYYPLAFFFNLLNLVILWVWDEFIYPMTFPIRLSCWIFIIKPLQIVKKILRKLKPLILFIISGITIGVLIGSMGGLVHLFIANRLFPLHLKTKISLSKPLQDLDLPDKQSIDNHNNHSTDYNDDDDDHPSVQKYHQDKEDQNLNQIEQLNKKKTQNRKLKKSIKETKRKGRKDDEEEISSELSSLEEDLIEKYWPISEDDEEEDSIKKYLPLSEEEEEGGGGEGSQIRDLIERNKDGYSSAIQSIINDRTRKRSSSSNFNLKFHSTTTTSSHMHPSSSSSSFPSNSKKNSSFIPSLNKKKVTFKID